MKKSMNGDIILMQFSLSHKNIKFYIFSFPLFLKLVCTFNPIPMATYQNQFFLLRTEMKLHFPDIRAFRCGHVTVCCPWTMGGAMLLLCPNRDLQLCLVNDSSSCLKKEEPRFTQWKQTGSLRDHVKPGIPILDGDVDENK